MELVKRLLPSSISLSPKVSSIVEAEIRPGKMNPTRQLELDPNCSGMDLGNSGSGQSRVDPNSYSSQVKFGSTRITHCFSIFF